MAAADCAEGGQEPVPRTLRGSRCWAALQKIRLLWQPAILLETHE